MSFSTAIGDLLFNNAFRVYRPLYSAFKNIQDRHELSLLRSIVKPGDTVLDIGANIGFYAAKLSALTGIHGSVHCFEPHPVNFSRLREAVMPYANVVLNMAAAADREGEISFYTSHELNVDHRAYRPEKFDQEIRVKSIRIDDYVRTGKIAKVDVIKMDIQGFELHALTGMKETIMSNPRVALLSEFWPYGLRVAGHSATKYFEALEDLGLEVYLAGKELARLSADQVRAMEHTGITYYNILAKRPGV